MIDTRTTSLKNWVSGECISVLDEIQQQSINVVVYDRNVDHLLKPIKSITEKTINFNTSGDIEIIIKRLKYELIYMNLSHDEISTFTDDIKKILLKFKSTCEVNSFQFLLSTINDDMCRRFHIDNNDLRLLCTFSGPGTLWLTENNVDRQALNSGASNQYIVIDKNEIRQANTGSIIVLKEALIYSRFSGFHRFSRSRRMTVGLVTPSQNHSTQRLEIYESPVGLDFKCPFASLWFVMNMNNYSIKTKPCNWTLKDKQRNMNKSGLPKRFYLH